MPDASQPAEPVAELETPDPKLVKPELGKPEPEQAEDADEESLTDLAEEQGAEEPAVLEVLEVLEETTRILETAEPDSEDSDEAESEEEEHEAILLEIFVNEAQGHLKTIDDFVIATRSMAPLYKAAAAVVTESIAYIERHSGDG